MDEMNPGRADADPALRGDPAARPLVACLCAEWCGSCRDYRRLFGALSATFGAAADFVWVDIEDHAGVLGEIEVDDFPTLLIAAGGEVRFFGPVMPHLQTAERLLRSALHLALPAVGGATVAALAARVREFGSANADPNRAGGAGA